MVGGGLRRVREGLNGGLRRLIEGFERVQGNGCME